MLDDTTDTMTVQTFNTMFWAHCC